MRIVDEVLEIMPKSAEALCLRGRVYIATGDAVKGMDELGAALEVDPGSKDARYHLARAFIKEGYSLLLVKRTEEALDRFRQAIALDAPEVDLTVVGRILEDHEKSEVAAAGPGKARRLFQEASALLEEGMTEEALALLNQSIEILPENPFAHYHAGLALDALDRTVEAEKELKTALDQCRSMNIALPATLLKLAEIAIRTGHYDEARRYLDAYDEEYPEQGENPLAKSLKRLLLLK